MRHGVLKLVIQKKKRNWKKFLTFPITRHIFLFLKKRDYITLCIYFTFFLFQSTTYIYFLRTGQCFEQKHRFLSTWKVSGYLSWLFASPLPLSSKPWSQPFFSRLYLFDGKCSVWFVASDPLFSKNFYVLKQMRH